MNFILPSDVNRASTPLFAIVILILSYINSISIYYTFGIILSSNINKLFKKYLFEPLMGDKDLPILGKGTRPPGAKNCRYFRDNFLNKAITPKPAKGYGMPSGHSQSSAFFLSFIYEYFRDNPYIFYPSLLYSLYIPYSRVQFGCHTYQQVIVGFLSGLIFYYVLNNIYKYLKKLYNNKSKLEKE